MSKDNEQKLRVLQHTKEKELLDRLRQQKALMMLNRHCWISCVANDPYAVMLDHWIDDTNKMIDVLLELQALNP